MKTGWKARAMGKWAFSPKHSLNTAKIWIITLKDKLKAHKLRKSFFFKATHSLYRRLPLLMEAIFFLLLGAECTLLKCLDFISFLYYTLPKGQLFATGFLFNSSILVSISGNVLCCQYSYHVQTQEKCIFQISKCFATLLGQIMLSTA
uniref:Uncharacterized protein n=1 Tax=Micrurus lemniscatus lemniscatus TaxID=129467 RepID=A0A2D4HM64_MICLE